jgi:hypothetical protein
MTFKLLSTANPKIQKGTKLGYLSFILHLAPADLSGHNTCPKATAGCKSACLNTAGRGGMFKRGESTNAIQKARIRKTKYFYEDRAGFMLDLAYDIQKGIKLAEKLGLKPVFRLNGTSDLSWEKYEVPVFCTKNIFELYPNVQFYDYTKILGRKADYANYFLIFSQADGNEADVNKAIAQGMNVATVFDEVPESYKGRPVINADETDLRFLDPKGVIAGLKAKGRAKKDYSGFVIRLKEIA